MPKTAASPATPSPRSLGSIATGMTPCSDSCGGPATRTIDLKGRSVLPGLFDNHTHVVRGGLNYNLELRWDGVRSLADAMDMLKRQVAITPAPQITEPRGSQMVTE